MAKNKVNIDTSSLSYDPNDPNFITDLEKNFPSFKEYEGTKAIRFKLFAWIVIMFDINSPVRMEAKDYYERKVRCAGIVGMNPNSSSGKYKEDVEEILLGKNKEINKLSVDYITSFSSPEYTQLIGVLIIQRQLMQGLLRGSYNDKTANLLETTSNQISNLTRRIYHSGDKIEVEEARRALYHKAGEDLNKMRPESIAEMLDSGDGLPDEWNPYGEEYDVDDISFVGDDPEIAKIDE